MGIKFSEDLIPLTDLKANPGRVPDATGSQEARLQTQQARRASDRLRSRPGGEGNPGLKAETDADLFFFEPEPLIRMARVHQDAYRLAEPFPHVVIDDFLPVEIAEGIQEGFPRPDFAGYRRQPDSPFQVSKLGQTQESNFKGLAPFVRHMLNEFNSMAFIMFLEELTGISGLIPDPHFRGGALHQILPGGSLAVHADFNRDTWRELDRRINVLIYFNKDWKEEHGGHIELWNKDMTECIVKAAPLFNRCLIFNTTSTSFHGHPDPLNCPDGETRNSIALYYYTNGRPQHEVTREHSTLWQDRPGERIWSASQKLRRRAFDLIRFLIPGAGLKRLRKWRK